MLKNLQTESNIKKEGNIDMTKKAKILFLYYMQHLEQKEIAKKVHTTKQYVSMVVNQDSRNIAEKENQKQSHKEKRKDYLNQYFKSYKRFKKEDNSYEQLLALQRQDSIEMSYSNKGKMSNYEYLKWTRNAYEKNKSDSMVLNKSLTAGFTTPKNISMKAKIPTQKYKHRDCFSR